MAGQTRRYPLPGGFFINLLDILNRWSHFR
jgi:hypothetical protein